MQKVFIVEDDKTIVKSLIAGLKADFSVRAAINFRAVKQEALEFEADLVLMDLGLPFYSGFYWTQELRKVSQLPIIFISSTSDELNQVSAMAQGADDFVTKPFSLEVLRAKIQAILRRTSIEKLEFAGFELLNSAVTVDGFAVELTPSENKILMALFKAQGATVAKEDLLQALWQTDDFIDANTLNVKMTRLRKKLADIDFDRRIITKRGLGYALE